MSQTNGTAPPVTNAQLEQLARNNAFNFSRFLSRVLDPSRDLDHECHWPETITIQQYKLMYDRDPVANRVCCIYPNESWSVDPHVYEQEDSQETAFETAWNALEKRLNLLSYLHRVDVLSGIGQYGVLLLGLDDGKPLSEPVDGIDENGQPVGKPKQRQLLYVRAFDQVLAPITKVQSDQSSARYMQPTEYELKFANYQLSGSYASTLVTESMPVHWSRIHHVTDRSASPSASEVFAVPRMQPVFDRLLDIRKVLGSSAEMFYKGGFPGYAFSVDPKFAGVATFDSASLKAEVADFQNGLSRTIGTVGMNVTSLATQVADPSKHINAQLQAIAMALECPLRVLLGSEMAKLASIMDSRSWNKRLSRRQEKYISPFLIEPLCWRLAAIGVLPTPTEINTEWPDLNSLSDTDAATVAHLRTMAMGLYISSNVRELIPPLEYLTGVLGYEQEEAQAIIEASDALAKEDEAKKAAERAANPPQPVAPAGKEMVLVPAGAAQESAAVAAPSAAELSAAK